MEADVLNHIFTGGSTGGLGWVLWRIRQLEIRSAKQEVQIEHQKGELEKGDEKFDKLIEEIQGLRREFHNLSLRMAGNQPRGQQT